MPLHFVEFDILRDSSQDLSKGPLWESIYSQIDRGEWDVLILTPPCGTFTRARHNYTADWTGPRPLRDLNHPFGFPWLGSADRKKAEQGNFFAERCIEAAERQSKVGKFWFFEHPEDLGKCKNGETPASVWQWPRMNQLIKDAKAATWAVNQCEFGANSRKPTRLASNLPAALVYGDVLPAFDSLRFYLGPLAPCSHSWHEPLIGLTNNEWKTSAAAAYPGKFCEFISFLCLSAMSKDPKPQEFQTDTIPEAEQLAASLLHRESISAAQVLQLFDILPHSAPHQASLDSPGSSFTAGAYAHWKGIMGCRTTCASFPFSVQLFCKFISQVDVQHQFTSFTILSQVGAGMHRDAGNLVGSSNLIIAISKFTKGDVWVADTSGNVFRELPDGSVVPGKLLPVATSPQYLPAQSAWHSTEPWSGRRVVLVAYSVGDPALLSSSDRSRLCLLGFNLSGAASQRTHGGFPAPQPRMASASLPSQGAQVSGQGAQVGSGSDASPGPATWVADQGAQVSPGPAAMVVGQSAQVAGQGAQVCSVPEDNPAKLSQVQGTGARLQSGPGAQVPGQGPLAVAQGEGGGGHRPPNMQSLRSKCGKYFVSHTRDFVNDPLDTVRERPNDQADHVAYDPDPLDEDTAGIKLDDSDNIPRFDPGLSRAVGQPMTCRLDARRKVFNDGFGLCSPGRWRPEARGVLETPEERQHGDSVFALLQEFVKEKLPDPRRAAFQLVSGQLPKSPFKEEDVHSLRAKVAGLLPDPEAALRVAERQPFFLSLLSQSLRLFGDPDTDILCEGTDSFSSGVPLGHRSPLPRTPQVFKRRVKFRQLDQTPFEATMENYASAELSADQLEAQFKKGAEKGMMIATTVASATREYGEGEVLVAAMGAVEKPNGEVRPLHDATHGVNLNTRIVIQDKLEVPGPEELAETVRLGQASGEVCFSVSADIAQAHRRIKVKHSDWGCLGCKTSTGSKVLWLNAVGTFGVSSASYWWTRLFACVGRWTLRLLRNRWNIQIVYVDDLHIVVKGPGKFVHLWILLLAYELVGTPFSYHKFGGGLSADFIGHRLSYQTWTVGISHKRTCWVIEWIDSLERHGFQTTGRAFVEFVGRANFIARVLTWMKPFRAPLFAFSAVLGRGTCARVPEMAFVSLRYIRQELSRAGGQQSVNVLWGPPQDVFRTDAKCSPGVVVLGGWLLGSSGSPREAAWFSTKVSQAEAPWLFDEKGDSHWASTSAELLASYAAMHVFGFLRPSNSSVRDCLKVMVSAGTDNQSTPALQKKGITSKWPLMALRMQVSTSLQRAQKGLRLTWRPRDVNTEADALTNSDFSMFSPNARVTFEYKDLPLDLFESLSAARDSFVATCEGLKSIKPAEPSLSRSKKVSTPW